MLSALQRFFEAAECRTQVELAEFLSIRQSSISDAKRRGSIPSDWLLTLWRKKGVNPDWVLTGLGPRGLRAAGCVEPPSPTVYTKEIRLPEECSVEELLVAIVRKILKTTAGDNPR